VLNKVHLRAVPPEVQEILQAYLVRECQRLPLPAVLAALIMDIMAQPAGVAVAVASREVPQQQVVLEIRQPQPLVKEMMVEAMEAIPVPLILQVVVVEQEQQEMLQRQDRLQEVVVLE
jgi:hypothetical protein